VEEDGAALSVEPQAATITAAMTSINIGRARMKIHPFL
jgi:hypothetical protein